MSQIVRISVVLALVAGLAAAAAFLSPVHVETATAQAPVVLPGNDFQEGQIEASGTCASDEIEIHCEIWSDACGRSFTGTSCCDRDDTASCHLVESASPPCSSGFAFSCS